MSKKGRSPNNSAIKGFFGRLKVEFFYGRDWSGWSIHGFMDALDEYIHWYNARRGSSYHWEECVLCDTEDHWGLERVRFPGHQVKGERRSIWPKRERNDDPKMTAAQNENRENFSRKK